MSLQRRFIAGDEELGKKYDDHRGGGRSLMPTPTTTTFTWRGPRRKRILLALLVFGILYVFFKNLPRDAVPATHRQGYRPRPPGSPPYAPSAPNGPPPRSDNSVETQRYFEGPIKYYHLASSIGAGLGPLRDNRDVLFAVSSLKSAASLLPLACDMSKQNKNRVHLLLTGRDAMAIEDIEKINAVTEADCSIKWHDGRPDFAIYSTDYRMEASVRASLGHFNIALKPTVVLVDSPDREDLFFSKGIKDKTRELGLPLVELPTNAAEHLKWISKLGGSSLKAWNQINIEILIHAPPESSGSLIRLLKSLENADYFGFPLPRLTIELPSNIDPSTSRYLADFQWPRGSDAGSSKLTLRHRLLSSRVDATQASIRQIESYYPSDVPRSHVLVLSPQVELSPLYFHYLVYTLLDYKYSNTALHTAADIMGISLDRPSTALNGREPLSTPEEASTRSLFLYQSPNSNAALYYGDKWVELHSFLSNRFAVDKSRQSPMEMTYSISEQYPSWLGYVLELARARGYTMLYPAIASSEDALATIHTELYHPPEEYIKPAASSSVDTAPPQETPLSAPVEPKALEPQVLTISRSILHLLNPRLPAWDSGGPLPDPSTLPVLSFTGEHLPQGQVSLNQAALTYAESFARDFGGCKTNGGEDRKQDELVRKRPKRKPWSADDLFCLEEAEMEAGWGDGLTVSAAREGDGQDSSSLDSG